MLLSAHTIKLLGGDTNTGKPATNEIDSYKNTGLVIKVFHINSDWFMSIPRESKSENHRIFLNISFIQLHLRHNGRVPRENVLTGHNIDLVQPCN